MDERMLLWSFVGFVLIGITAIAYKEPEVYRKLTLGLIPISLCLVFGSVGWSLGQSSAYQSLAPHIAPDRVKVLMTGFLDAIDEKCVYDVAMLVVIAYLFLLGYLTRLFKAKETASAAEPASAAAV